MRLERHVIFWVIAAGLFLIGITVLNDILLPFVAGIILAYALNPSVDFLERRGARRGVASFAVVAGLGVIAVLLLLLIVPPLVRQSQELARALPGAFAQVRDFIEGHFNARTGAESGGIEKASDAIAENWQSVAAWLASSLWSGGLALVNFLALALITPVVVFYLLVDWHTMLKKVNSWLPRDQAPTIRALASDMNESVAAFVRGQGAVCLIMAAFYAIGLTLVGLNYGLLIGLMSGLITFIPFAGAALGFLTSAAVAVTQFWPEIFPIALVIAVFLAGQALEGAILTPTIMGSRLGLHPVWVIFALFVFGYLFGFVGALIAVPLAAAVSVLARFALKTYLESSVYKGRAASPGAQTPKTAETPEGRP